MHCPKIIKHPDQINWVKGEVPCIHTVSKDSCIIVWIVDKNDDLLAMQLAHPYKNKLNPLKWCTGRLPLRGWLFDGAKVKYWAWIKK